MCGVLVAGVGVWVCFVVGGGWWVLLCGVVVVCALGGVGDRVCV